MSAADPEQALCIPSLPESVPDGYSRLYFGAEFCPWRQPSPAEIRAALEWCRVNRWSFTLLTPVLIELERDSLQHLLDEILPELEADDEVLVSDWGTLEMIRTVREDATVILGRALSGQKRGPRILDMALGSEEQAYFRQCSWSSRDAVTLLSEYAIGRVELDNLLQGLAPLPTPLKGSLHLPYAMVTSSRNCPYREAGSSESCPAPCGAVFQLTTADTDVRLLQAGNTQFLENDRLPDDPAALGVDRIVTHTDLPR